jgi:hypothetical protein
MDLVEIRGGGVDEIGLAQDGAKWRALVNAVLKLRFSLKAERLSGRYTIGGLLSSAHLHIVM